MQKYKTGNTVKATVTGITEYGIFVKIDDEYTGLIHISEISDKFVHDPKQYVEEQEQIYGEIVEVDEINKKLKLSIKNIQYRQNGEKKGKIIETEHGFDTLLYKLPYWINENIKNHQNETNCIDK